MVPVCVRVGGEVDGFRYSVVRLYAAPGLI